MVVWEFWLRPKGRYIQDSWVQRSRGEKKNWQGKWWDFASKKQRCNWGCCWRKQRLKQQYSEGYNHMRGFGLLTVQ